MLSKGTDEVKEQLDCFGGRRPESPSTVRVPSVRHRLGGDTDVEPCAAGEGTRARRALRPSCARRAVDHRRRDASAGDSRRRCPCVREGHRVVEGQRASTDREHLQELPSWSADRHPQRFQFVSLKASQGRPSSFVPPQHIAGRANRTPDGTAWDRRRPLRQKRMTVPSPSRSGTQRRRADVGSSVSSAGIVSSPACECRIFASLRASPRTARLCFRDLNRIDAEEVIDDETAVAPVPSVPYSRGELRKLGSVLALSPG